MNESSSGLERIDGCAGLVSATGHDCEYLSDAVSKWNATSSLNNAPNGTMADSGLTPNFLADITGIESSLTRSLQTLTGHNEQQIHRCLVSSSTEEALQWIWVLTRRSHKTPDAKCLIALGGDHGSGVVGRMASGRAASRSPEWPMLPGFVHVELDDLAGRINEDTSMVLLSPIDLHDMSRSAGKDSLIRVREACDQHSVALVIDHQAVPPMGGGDFWVHESVAGIQADAVLMSAGLLGGVPGGLLVLNERLSSVVNNREMVSHELNTYLIEASLRQWIDQDWLAVDVDEMAVQWAERLASRETVRDLHVTGRTIGIELDMPSADWIELSDRCGLEAKTAGDFAVRFQPPLVLDEQANEVLLERLDLVFDTLQAEEADTQNAEPANASEPETDQEQDAEEDTIDEDSEQDAVSIDESDEIDQAENDEPRLSAETGIS